MKFEVTFADVCTPFFKTAHTHIHKMQRYTWVYSGSCVLQQAGVGCSLLVTVVVSVNFIIFPCFCFEVNARLGLCSTECGINFELLEQFGLSLFVDLPLCCF